jgi:hypothetical protein
MNIGRFLFLCHYWPTVAVLQTGSDLSILFRKAPYLLKWPIAILYLPVRALGLFLYWTLNKVWGLDKED